MNFRTRTLVFSLCFAFLACGTVASAKNPKRITHRQIIGAVANTKQTVTNESATTRKTVADESTATRQYINTAVKTATDPLKQQLADAQENYKTLWRHSATIIGLLIGALVLQLVLGLVVRRRFNTIEDSVATPVQDLPDGLMQFPSPDGRFQTAGDVEGTLKKVGYFCPTDGQRQFAVLHGGTDRRFPRVRAPFIELIAQNGVVEEGGNWTNIHAWVAMPNGLWNRVYKSDAYQQRSQAA